MLTAATVVTICDCLKFGCDHVTSPEKNLPDRVIWAIFYCDCVTLVSHTHFCSVQGHQVRSQPDIYE